MKDGTWAFLFLLTVSAGARAVDWTVDSTADTQDAVPGDGLCADAGGGCSLRAAIQESNALAGPDRVLLGAQTYLLTIIGPGEDVAMTGDLDIVDDLEIRGAGMASTAVRQNAAGHRVFDVFNQPDRLVTASMESLAIENGSVTGDGGGIRNQGILHLSEVRMMMNSASGNGGAIHNEGTGDVTVSESHFEANVATNEGGAVNNSASPVNLKGGFGGPAGTATVEINNSDFVANQGRAGGAVNNSQSGDVIIRRGLFSMNRADPRDGGAGNNNSSNSLFRVENARMVGNTAVRNGGALNNNSQGVMEVIRSEISGNDSGQDGGGVNNNSSGTDNFLLVAGSAVTGNQAVRDGGGVHTFGLSRIENSTISNNTAGRNGGGFKAGGDSNILLNNTITGNATSGMGGGVFAFSCDVVAIKNTIIANSVGDDCGFVESSLASAPEIFVSLGNNIDGDGTCQLVQASDFAATDPLLEPLGANGGPGLSQIPQLSSVARDGGDSSVCPPDDQRGVSRQGEAGNCDIGSIERIDNAERISGDGFETQGLVPIAAPGQTQACIDD